MEFSYNFLYVWNCMKLYEKKFLIYGNCMIRSFGQPGDTNNLFLREFHKLFQNPPFFANTVKCAVFGSILSNTVF